VSRPHRPPAQYAGATAGELASSAKAATHPARASAPADAACATQHHRQPGAGVGGARGDWLRCGVAATPHRLSGGGARRVLPLGGRSSRGGCDERFSERGAATVWVVGGLAVLMVVMTGVLWFGAAVVARHRAEGAADLAALAAAVTAVEGEQRACVQARWVVERMGTVLRSCRLSGWDALVEVDATFASFGSAAGRARAGPVVSGR
jgi:secretion/DNA translocation related TadE-like protein